MHDLLSHRMAAPLNMALVVMTTFPGPGTGVPITSCCAVWLLGFCHPGQKVRLALWGNSSLQRVQNRIKPIWCSCAQIWLRACSVQAR